MKITKTELVDGIAHLHKCILDEKLKAFVLIVEDIITYLEEDQLQVILSARRPCINIDNVFHQILCITDGYVETVCGLKLTGGAVKVCISTCPQCTNGFYKKHLDLRPESRREG